MFYMNHLGVLLKFADGFSMTGKSLEEVYVKMKNFLRLETLTSLNAQSSEVHHSLVLFDWSSARFESVLLNCVYLSINSTM